MVRVVPVLVLLAASALVACGSSSASPGGGEAGAGDAQAGEAGGEAGSDGGGSDASPGVDASTDGAGGDGAGNLDAGPLPSTLEGIWLVGWVGGQNHYSWVRFDSLQGGGAADTLDGANLTANVPYWSCSGTGSWALDQKPQTVTLTFAASCSLPAITLTFDSFAPHQGYPAGATLDAKITDVASGQQLTGWKFPASQCDGAMTSCNNPF